MSRAFWAVAIHALISRLDTTISTTKGVTKIWANSHNDEMQGKDALVNLRPPFVPHKHRIWPNDYRPSLSNKVLDISKSTPILIQVHRRTHLWHSLLAMKFRISILIVPSKIFILTRYWQFWTRITKLGHLEARRIGQAYIKMILGKK